MKPRKILKPQTILKNLTHDLSYSFNTFNQTNETNEAFYKWTKGEKVNQ